MRMSRQPDQKRSSPLDAPAPRFRNIPESSCENCGTDPVRHTARKSRATLPYLIGRNNRSVETAAWRRQIQSPGANRTDRLASSYRTHSLDRSSKVHIGLPFKNCNRDLVRLILSVVHRRENFGSSFSDNADVVCARDRMERHHRWKTFPQFAPHSNRDNIVVRSVKNCDTRWR